MGDIKPAVKNPSRAVRVAELREVAGLSFPKIARVILKWTRRQTRR
jgi:hypothetical protein